MNTEHISSTPVPSLSTPQAKQCKSSGAPVKDEVTLTGANAGISTISMEMVRQACRGSAGELSNAHTRARAEELLEMKKKGTTDETIVNNDKHVHIVTHGVPSYVKPFDHEGVTFRHYFATDDQKENALAMQALIAGPVSYAQVSPGLRIDFPDLAGVFLTLPNVKPENVGVPGHTGYVDMKLPADTSVLEIEKGSIYLIAGEPKLPDWIVNYYNKYKAGETVPEYMLSTMKKIEAGGGIKEATEVYFYPLEK